MKLKGFIDVSLVDWDGHVACVVFTPGCNLRCPYCYNADLVLRPHELPDIPVKRVLSYLEEDGWSIDGVVITGGEPTLWHDLPELCATFKRLGLAIKLDTNGSSPQMLERLVSSGLVDYVALDVKAPLTPEKYSAACGVDARPILPMVGRSMEFLISSDLVDYELRTTIVPTLHEPGDVKAICEAIEGCRRYVLQAFRPLGLTINPIFSSLKPLTEGDLKPFFEEAVEALGGDRVSLRA